MGTWQRWSWEEGMEAGVDGGENQSGWGSQQPQAAAPGRESGPGERDVGCRRLSHTQGSAPRACSGGRPASRPSARSSGSTTKVRRLPGPLGLGLPPSRASAPTPMATELSPAPRQPGPGPLPGETLAGLPQAATRRRPAWGLLPAPGWFVGRDGSAEAPSAAARHWGSGELAYGEVPSAPRTPSFPRSRVRSVSNGAGVGRFGPALLSPVPGTGDGESLGPDHTAAASQTDHATQQRPR